MMDDVKQIGLIEDEEIALDVAALVLSACDHDGLDLEPCFDLLDAIEERLRVVGRGAIDPARQARALATVLHGEFGFIGDGESHDAPLNADLIRVLDRRRGLPVSLSILYVALARRLGWSAWALNMPGHVLVRIGAEPFVVIDPFHGGVPVSEQQLVALVRQFPGQGAHLLPDYLQPVSNRATLLRLLVNQAVRAERDGDAVRALTIHERMTMIAPGDPDSWWELARLQMQLHDAQAARQSSSAMLEVTRDPERRMRAMAALDAIEPG
ncbi:MAG: transglutaminase-like domain-containing protein [Novosphingobium sp.]|nr:transglutaminase-like domain-containing protein [Novosphingobium sp.]